LSRSIDEIRDQELNLLRGRQSDGHQRAEGNKTHHLGKKVRRRRQGKWGGTGADCKMQDAENSIREKATGRKKQT